MPARPRVSLPLVLAVLGALLGLLVAGCERSGSGAADEYVAMGDSYSSGAGIAPVTDAPCNRSSKNYASLVAERLGYSLTDVTCGGAATADLSHAQPGTGNGPQLDALGTSTRLVTLTLGLNDDNVSYGLLYSCLSTSGQPTSACQQLVGTPQSAVQAEVTGLAARVRTALDAIRSRAPKARVVLVGYPRILPDVGDCPDRLPLVQPMEARLRQAMRSISEAWARAAHDAGADFVDTWTMSAGHDVCSEHPWVNGSTWAADRAAPLHPFPAFHRAVADAIVKLLKRR